jgi:hypothetical protein
VTELDLTTAEAVTAWQTVTPLYDKIHAIRQATARITRPTPA